MSQFPDLLASMATSITARHLITPMAAATWFPDGGVAADAAKDLRTLGYDAAPVRSAGRLVGYVTRNRLERARPGERVGDWLVPLDQCALASSDSPVRSIISCLTSETFVFVLEDRGFTGFITPADLDRTPARAFFYVRLVEVEARLAALIAQGDGGTDSALSLLSPERQRSIDGRRRKQIAANVELDPITYADFRDLIEVIANSHALLASVGTTAGVWRSRTSRLAELRVRLMHAVRPLVSKEFPVAVLADAMAQLDDLAAMLLPR